MLPGNLGGLKRMAPSGDDEARALTEGDFTGDIVKFCACPLVQTGQSREKRQHTEMVPVLKKEAPKGDYGAKEQSAQRNKPAQGEEVTRARAH